MLNNTSTQNQSAFQAIANGLETSLLSDSANNPFLQKPHELVLSSMDSNDWALTPLSSETTDVSFGITGAFHELSALERLNNSSDFPEDLKASEIGLVDELTGIAPSVSLESPQEDTLLNQTKDFNKYSEIDVNQLLTTTSTDTPESPAKTER